MVKKKVSFDLDQELLEEVRQLCKTKRIKLSEFFRVAAREKLENDQAYISIYVALDGVVKNYSIEISKYEIDLHEASHEMRINVGAECEGVARLKMDGFAIEERRGKEQGELEQIISENGGKIKFYTTRKYC